MTFELILRYFHFISIFVIVGALVSEYVLLEPFLIKKKINRLSKIDGIYGLAVLSLLVAGFTLWLGGYGKPTEFYSQNPVFFIKLGMFVAIGLLSIYPTVFFVKNRKGDQNDIVAIPKAVFWMVRLELLLIFIIPFFAGLMAKGMSL
jgi:putative membrane protein